jgi:hypothetical protein
MTVLNVIRRPVTVIVQGRPVTVIVQGRGLMGFKGDKGDPGNLTGPESSVDENIPIFDGVEGDKLKDSGVKLSDKADASDLNTLDQTVDTLIPVIANMQSRISAQEALLTGYNPTGADRVEVSSTAQEITLPANVAEGGLNVLQGGMTLTNLATNGDFSDGTKLWSMAGTNSLVINSDDVVVTLKAGTTGFYGFWPIVINNVYFVKVRIKTTSTKVYLRMPYSSISRYHTGSGEYEELYGVANVSETSPTSIGIRTDATHDPSIPIYIDRKTGVYLINLTTLGLTDKTADEINNMVNAGYFDGEKSATARRIKVVDTDDERPTCQYVEPIILRRLPDGTRDTIENGTHIQRVSDDGTEALATPITTYGVVTGMPIAYPNGTITLEPVLADVGYYTDKFEISRTGYPIVSLETLSIVDIATGQLTSLDASAAIIAEDGLSFTHAELTAGDLVDVTYFWDYNGVYGENTFGYLDSEVVKADTHNGKFYKAVPSFTDGVLTWTVEEVV